MFETIFLKMSMVSSEKPSEWMQNIIVQVNKYQILKFVVSPATTESGNNVIETLKSSKPVSVTRQSFRLLLDCVLIIVTVLIYAFMFVKLMPFSSEQYNTSIIYETIL